MASGDVQTYYNDLCDNLNVLGAVPESDYWEGAFNSECGQPRVRWDSVCTGKKPASTSRKHPGAKPQRAGCGCAV